MVILEVILLRLQYLAGNMLMLEETSPRLFWSLVTTLTQVFENDRTIITISSAEEGTEIVAR